MKKDILKSIVEIILILFFVIWSIPAWDAFASQIPDINGNISCVAELEMKLLNDYRETELMSREELNTLEPSRVLVTNNSDKQSCGKLVLNYSKSAVLNYKYLSVKIDNEIINLSSLLMTTDDNYYIFIIDNLDLAANASREYDFYIKINEEELEYFNLDYYNYNLNLSITY